MKCQNLYKIIKISLLLEQCVLEIYLYLGKLRVKYSTKNMAMHRNLIPTNIIIYLQNEKEMENYNMVV